MRFIATWLGLIVLASNAFASPTTAFKLSTPVAFDQGQLPAAYTCDGENITPKLIWADAPANTQAFALIFSDPDAPSGTFYHWVLYNIPKEVAVLDKAITTLPTGTEIGVNSAQTTTYKSPCPPKGPRHHYLFTLYALDEKLDLPAGKSATDIQDAMKNHVLAQTVLTVLYGR